MDLPEIYESGHASKTTTGLVNPHTGATSSAAAKTTKAPQVMMEYAMVIVCRMTGYVMAIPCRKEGLDNRKAAELFLQICGFFMGLPCEIHADSQLIISSTFFNALCNLAGIE